MMLRLMLELYQKKLAGSEGTNAPWRVLFFYTLQAVDYEGQEQHEKAMAYYSNLLEYSPDAGKAMFAALIQEGVDRFRDLGSSAKKQLREIAVSASQWLTAVPGRLMSVVGRRNNTLRKRTSLGSLKPLLETIAFGGVFAASHSLDDDELHGFLLSEVQDFVRGIFGLPDDSSGQELRNPSGMRKFAMSRLGRLFFKGTKHSHHGFNREILKDCFRLNYRPDVLDLLKHLQELTPVPDFSEEWLKSLSTGFPYIGQPTILLIHAHFLDKERRQNLRDFVDLVRSSNDLHIMVHVMSGLCMACGNLGDKHIYRSEWQEAMDDIGHFLWEQCKGWLTCYPDRPRRKKCVLMEITAQQYATCLCRLNEALTFHREVIDRAMRKGPDDESVRVASLVVELAGRAGAVTPNPQPILDLLKYVAEEYVSAQELPHGFTPATYKPRTIYRTIRHEFGADIPSALVLSLGRIWAGRKRLVEEALEEKHPNLLDAVRRTDVVVPFSAVCNQLVDRLLYGMTGKSPGFRKWIAEAGLATWSQKNVRKACSVVVREVLCGCFRSGSFDGSEE